MITLWCTLSFSYLMMAEALWFTSQGVWQFVQPPPRVMSVGPWRLIPEMPNNLTVFQHIFRLQKNQKRFSTSCICFFWHTWIYGASWYLMLGSSEMENDELTDVPWRFPTECPPTDLGKRTERWRTKATRKAHVDGWCNGGLHDLILDHIFSICFQKHVNRICPIIAFFGGKKIKSPSSPPVIFDDFVEWCPSFFEGLVGW